jgi:hypothetical protein
LDVSLPSLAPRVVADHRPTDDAADTARIDRPPLAIAAGVPVAVPSLSQEALVARSAIGPITGDATDSAIEAPERVLKPWSVPMLPWDRPSDGPRQDTPADDSAPEASGRPDVAPAGPSAEVLSDPVSVASAGLGTTLPGTAD